MNRRRKLLIRWFYYIIGMPVLALGLVLNAKSDLGASPITSISYTASFLCDISFADLTLMLYVVMVGLQFVLKGKRRRLRDVLQIPLSIVFTRFMNLFSVRLDFSGASLGMRLLVLMLGVMFTGIGAALTVDMDLIANPGDGLVQSVGMRFGKDQGFAKNIVDICCVVISAVIGFAVRGKLVGVGPGTIIAMICVGRVIWLFNHLFRDALLRQAFPEDLSAL